MNTAEIIGMLTLVTSDFPELGEFGNAAALRELVKSEIESPDERFLAIPPKNILHIISANTPMAGMQTLIRGLLMGSMNWCKIPSSGLPRFIEFVEKLPSELRKLVEISSELRDHWLAEAEAVVVFGSDETVAHFRGRMRPDQIFAGYGNRWSGAVIFEDLDFESLDPVVRDIGLYEQQGCLSAQIVWLHESVDALEYGRRLSEALAIFVLNNPSSPLDLAGASSIARWRADAEWRQITTGRGQFWWNDSNPFSGVVLLEKGDVPSLSCLHRHVSLVQFDGDFPVGHSAKSLSTLGLWPYSSELKNRLLQSGASRICEVGRMQFPHPAWRQDGHQTLGRLVGWIGIE